MDTQGTGDVRLIPGETHQTEGGWYRHDRVLVNEVALDGWIQVTHRNGRTETMTRFESDGVLGSDVAWLQQKNLEKYGPRLVDILRTRGEPIGHFDRHNAQATITWNTQGWILEAPPDAHGLPRKYLPCDGCGKVMMVGLNVVSGMCGYCDEDSQHFMGERP